MPRKQRYWPLRPSTTAYILDGLISALSDFTQENGSDFNHRQSKQLVALGLTAELCAEALAHWFASRPPEDHDMLEMLQERTEDFGDR
ncbi:MAG TPA: hypothetical protein VF275_01785 [Gammaproteobacteria bacterium]